ncbi:MAG: hypothetical protein WDM81_12410 [Rhizomicrobium sp.]
MIARAASLLLLASSLAAWLVAAGARPPARVHVRFAAVLFAALGVASLVAQSAVPAIALLVLPIGLSVLGLGTAAARTRPLEPALAASLLAAVSLAALAAAVTGLTALSLAPSALGAVAIGMLGARAEDRLGVVQGVAAAFCFLGAASAFALADAGPELTLFCAAGLLGLALALSRSGAAVEERPGRDLRGLAIGRRRPD